MNTEEKSTVLYPSVTDRYYTRRYKLGTNGDSTEDQCVLFHSNRICVVTVATSHPLISLKKKVIKVDFQVKEGVNRLQNEVSGKGKRGGQWQNEDSPICHVKCEDGSTYTLYSCVRGTLVEVNERLVDNPNLLVLKPQSEGYVAIVMPKLRQSEIQRVKLVSHEEYQNTLIQREKPNENAPNIPE